MALGLLLAISSGCVRVYQPMSGLHRPVIVDTQAPNFADLDLTVHCVPGAASSPLSRGEAGVDHLNPGRASLLCKKVGTLFENQGAIVRTISTVGLPDDAIEGEFEQASGTDIPKEDRSDLTVELKSRILHNSRHPLSWILCVGSFTVLPGITEETFALDVSIRDENGFLLASDTLEGRLLQRFGLGPWAGNALMDWLVRKKDEKLIFNAQADLSNDIYGQLSQQLFNAKIQWEVLQEQQAGPNGVGVR